MSLRESGKSRADLWALAAIVSVEYGIETNNMVCDGTFKEGWQCNPLAGTEKCHVSFFQPRTKIFFQDVFYLLKNFSWTNIS